MIRTILSIVALSLALTTATAAFACPDGQTRVCDATQEQCVDRTVCDEWGKDGSCNHYQTVRSCTPVCVHWACQ
jgi:hypothetical protein